MQVTAGKQKKGDLLVTLDDESLPLSITITSSVERLYGKQIRKVAEETVQELGLTEGNLRLEDNQALDFVIRARIIAAADRLKKRRAL